ncbi:MAG: hypothetical protein ACKOCV_07985 [Gemmatimonadota bacterium]
MTPHRPLSTADVEALLRALPRHAPKAGFADRVLARVPLRAPVPLWRRIPWRAVAGLLTLELGLVAIFVIRFRAELALLPVRLLEGLTRLLVAIRTAELGDATREFLLALVPRVGAVFASDTSILLALSLGAVGALLSISLLGRGLRAATTTQ